MRLPSSVYSLRATVIGIVLLPLLAVFGVGGVLVLGELEERVEERMQEDIALIARTLKTPLARSLERSRENSLDRALRSASQFGRVYGVYLYDHSGRLVAQADQSPAAVEASIPRVPMEIRETGGYRSMDGREVYSYFTPLTGSGGQAVGMLQITRRASDIRDYLATLRTNVVLGMLGFSTVLVAIILLGYHIVVGRPVQRLTATMDRVADGEAEARASVSGPEELRRLARRFNSMLGGIAERDAALGEERAEQARLEHKLRQSEKYALVGRLAAGVAHELGTPLSVIDGHAQRLLRGKEPGSADYGILVRIRESAERMSAIVRQLLGFGNDASPGRKPTGVQRLVSLAAADLRAQEGVEPEVVEGPPEQRVVVDETRMRDALVHLLRNALQASRGGRVRVGWASVAGGATRIYVENSGQPIPPADRERIFEPFVTTKGPGEGSGLGLAIVKSAVADHGGEIGIYDSPLGGAGVSIDLSVYGAGETGADDE